ncbi:hypothetical protein ACFE04_025364 [Oxalis oulophora]
MASSLNTCVLYDVTTFNMTKQGFASASAFALLPSSISTHFRKSNSRDFPVLKIGFMGNPVVVSDQKWSNLHKVSNFHIHAQALVSKAQRWWEKTLTPNMVEIKSAQHLVDSLLNAGDKLVVVDFYSPGCGGCRTLHPKICQLAGLYPDAIFLKVNQEDLKTMCYCLNIHVLPFFRFYRGAEGRLCSFSCTNATIKKFKDALVKHGTDRCSLDPVKGLEESELTELASHGELPVNLPLSAAKEEMLTDLVANGIDLPGLLFHQAEDSKMKRREDQSAAAL